MSGVFEESPDVFVAEEYMQEFEDIFTVKELQYFQKLFGMVDADQDGTVGFTELKSMCRHLGVELSDDKLKRSMSVVQDGLFDFHAFLTWLVGVGGIGSAAMQPDMSGDEWAVLKSKIRARGSEPLSNEQIESFRRIFDHFDQDGNGTIEKAELYAVFQAMGQKDMTLEYLDKLLLHVDDNSSGTIDFDEFLMLMCTGFSPKSSENHGEVNLEDQLLHDFHDRDPCKSGFVTADNLRAIIKSHVDDELSMEEIAEIVNNVVKERGDGFVEYKTWDGLWEACRFGASERS